VIQRPTGFGLLALVALGAYLRQVGHETADRDCGLRRWRLDRNLQ
jgi:hypothetical protein